MIEDLSLKLKSTISYIVEELMTEYGCDITLGELFLKLTQAKGYKCPKCKGRGFITIQENAYYSNIAVDFGYRTEYKDIECDLCAGSGFTDKPMKPKMVQDGWEIDE
jgi:DNA-directed RNA polymerase subunit RPC12/RpoP